MHDLLAAGFIPLRFDKQSKKDDSAFVELPRGFHAVYTSIEYKCASPLYRHTGSSRRTCLKTGRWSGRHVSCSPGESSSSADPANRNARLKGGYVALKDIYCFSNIINTFYNNHLPVIPTFGHSGAV